MAEDQTPSPDHKIQAPCLWRRLSDVDHSSIGLLILIAQPLMLYRKVLFNPQVQKCYVASTGFGPETYVRYHSLVESTNIGLSRGRVRAVVSFP